MPTQEELRALWESATPAAVPVQPQPALGQEELRALWESAEQPVTAPTPSPMQESVDGLQQFQEAYQPQVQPLPMIQEDVPTDVMLQQQAPPPAEPERGWGERLLGVFETGASAVTGATGGALGMIGGALEGAYEAAKQGLFGTPEGADIVERRSVERGEQLTYEPRTEAGREYLKEVGDFLAPMEAMGPVSPVSRMRYVARGVQRKAAAPVDKGTETFDVDAPDESIVPNPQPAPLSQKELASKSRKVAEGGIGSKRAERILKEQATIDPEVSAAAERLKIKDYLQDDHLTSNQQFRELSQAIKSVPTSELRQMEIDGLVNAAKRVDNILLEMGAKDDWSALSSDVKRALDKEQSMLLKQADDLYQQLEDAIDPRSRVATDNINSYLADKISKVGLENLTPEEKKIYNRMTPKDGQLPSYALLDQTRKELTAARVKKEGVFKDADSGLLKNLENELLKDQKIAADNAGQLDIFNNARRAVATRKEIENDLKSLFGKKLDENFLSKLQTGFTGLTKGDASKLNKILDAVPEEMRQDVVASGLKTAFGKNMRSGELSWTSFADWYRKASRNKEAFSTIIDNLPPESRRQLQDMYKVSDGISKASKERIATGRIMAVKEDLQAMDGLIANMYLLAKRAAPGVAIEAFGSLVGVPPGYGITAGITSALTKSKPDTIKSVDKLLSSPQFRDFVRNRDAKRLSRSAPFKNFVKSTGVAMADPELWLLEAMRQQEEQED